MPVTASAPAAPSRISRRGLILGIGSFVVLSAAGVGIAIWWKTPDIFDARILSRLALFLVFLIPLTAVDSLLGGIRYRLFFDGTALPRISIWGCMCSNWANVCLGAITPSQSGGGPAQLYILCQRGAKLSQATFVSLVNAAWTFFLFFLGSVLILTLHPADGFRTGVSGVLHSASVALASLITVIALSFVFPGFMATLFHKLIAAIPKRFQKRRRRALTLLARLESELLTYRETAHMIFKRRPGLLALSALATLFLFSNKYLIGVVIVQALQHQVPVFSVFTAQFVQHLLAYFAPTPGASGFAEVSSVWLMDAILAPQYLVLYAILWRFFTTIIGACLGALVLFTSLRRTIHGKRTSPVRSAGSPGEALPEEPALQATEGNAPCQDGYRPIFSTGEPRA